MKLILFRGRPGAGKTTISNLLSKEEDLPILRKDDIYDVAFEFIEDHTTKNKISYGSLYAILETNKASGCTFILDYPFQTTDDLSIIKQWCTTNDVELKSILVTCSNEALWAERFNVRASNPKPNQLLTNFEKMKEYYGAMQLTPELNELFIDTVNNQNTILEQIKTFIN